MIVVIIAIVIILDVLGLPSATCGKPPPLLFNSITKKSSISNYHKTIQEWEINDKNNNNNDSMYTNEYKKLCSIIGSCYKFGSNAR